MGADVKRYRVEITWMVPESGVFFVEAENEQQAEEFAVDQNDEVGEDYQIDAVKCLGEIEETPEPPYEDPNQLWFPPIQPLTITLE